MIYSWVKVETITMRMRCSARNLWEGSLVLAAKRISLTYMARKWISCLGVSCLSETHRNELHGSAKVLAKCFRWLTLTSWVVLTRTLKKQSMKWGIPRPTFIKTMLSKSCNWIRTIKTSRDKTKRFKMVGYQPVPRVNALLMTLTDLLAPAEDTLILELRLV